MNSLLQKQKRKICTSKFVYGCTKKYSKNAEYEPIDTIMHLQSYTSKLHGNTAINAEFLWT